MSENNLKRTEETNKSVIEVDPKRKRCFVITPIGEDNSSIRRHIDGVINAAIKPALEQEYDVIVAHEITKPGSINKQVIVEIYTADLIIANLTGLNPNVMYELALRHALKKPVILIMEKGDNVKLPFDIIAERTLFYVNDFQGVIDLKDCIVEAEKSVMDNIITSNPIYDALNSYAVDQSLIKNVENNDGIENATVLKAILDKLNQLEVGTSIKSPVMSVEVTKYRKYLINLEYDNYENDSEIARIQFDIMRRIKNNLGSAFTFQNESFQPDGFSFELGIISKDFNQGIRINVMNTIQEYIREKENGNENIKVTKFKVN